MKDHLKIKSRLLPFCLLTLTILMTGPAAAVRPITPSQVPEPGKMTVTGSEPLNSGSGERKAYEAIRKSRLLEAKLLRAEEQGIIDQGARTAIHIRQQEVQRDIRELR